MNKAKLLASLVLAAFGAFVAFYPLLPTIPKQSELEFASGVLLSSKFGSKSGSKFQLDGINKNFVYQSHGRLCGNVHDQLSAELGKPISIRYLPAQTKNRPGEAYSLRVFEISGQENLICSYEQISAMIENDFKVVPLLGYLILFMGLTTTLNVLFPSTHESAANIKTWEDLRRDLEAEAQAEEGEKIIGEQWKNLPTNNKAKH